MSTIKLDDGKYEFDIDDQTGLMTTARRHGETWEAGFEQRFSKAFMAALWRVRDLEAAAVEAAHDSTIALAECAQEGLRALSTAIQQSAAPSPQADAAPNTVTLDRRDLFDFVRGGIKAALEDGKAGEGMVASWYWQEATERAERVLGNLGIVDAAIAAGGAREPCATCNGHGMIGGPSYYAPDEGGEPCPDCAAPVPREAATGALTDEAIVDALKSAKQFIANGVALGYIRMPDADCPDPAHDTPKKIDAALALLAAAANGEQ